MNIKEEPSFIRGYNGFVGKLKYLLSENKQLKKFNFMGWKRVDKHSKKTIARGILVRGVDSLGVCEFERFFSINEINKLFYRAKNKYVRQNKKRKT